MEYIEIKEQIKQKLPVARDLGDSENLLELGPFIPDNHASGKPVEKTGG